MKIWNIDAFTTEKYKGNPAAIAYCENGLLETKEMQLIAAEMNLSETAFISKQNGFYQIKYFTPAVEVDLCGHATLASAHFLYERGDVAKDQTIEFRANKDQLFVQFIDGKIVMEFPLDPIQKLTNPPTYLQQIPNVLNYYQSEGNCTILQFSSEQEIIDFTPDIQTICDQNIEKLVITSPSNSNDLDFVSRFFAPLHGIEEDPVTGSAHCSLGILWSNVFDKNQLKARQISPRSGDLQLTIKEKSLVISGNAITILKGDLLVDNE